MFLFVGAFFKTIRREWSKIDRLRIDKFYMVSVNGNDRANAYTGCMITLLRVRIYCVFIIQNISEMYILHSVFIYSMTALSQILLSQVFTPSNCNKL